MAKYYVRDTCGYVTEVEADRYGTTNSGIFEFYKKEDGGSALVASFPAHATLSVVEAEEAFQAISLLDEALEENDEPGDPDQPEDCCEECGNDICLDCQFEDFLNSEEFITAVAEIAADVVQEFCGTPEPPPEVVELPVLTVLKATLKKTGTVVYGFITPEDKFIEFSIEANAEGGLEHYKDGVVVGWIESDLAEYTFAEIEPVVPQLTVLRGVHKTTGKRVCGFLTPDGLFVDYFEGEEADAREGLASYKEGDRTWHYENPDDYTFTEVENG
jgi:hypothetical protein